MRLALRHHLRCSKSLRVNGQDLMALLRAPAKIIRLNLQCFGVFWVATVQRAVNVSVVPDGAMATEISLGTDSWARFPVREYKDIGERETILTLRTTQREDRF